MSDHPNIIAHPPKIFAATLLSGILLHAFIPISFMSSDTLLRSIISIVIFAAAILVAMNAKRHMEKQNTNIHPKKSTTALVTDGVFRYTRNPLYLTLFLLHVVFAVFLNSFWILLFGLVLVTVLHFGVVKREEMYLENKFGEQYLRYKKKVWRWI